MSALPFLLADEETDAILASWRFADPSTREGLLVFGAIGLVTGLALIWALFIRKPKRRRHRHHHSHEHLSTVAESLEVTESPHGEPVAVEPREHRKRRRFRHRRRSRNPTLAETGGLPPVRPEGSSEPLP